MHWGLLNCLICRCCLTLYNNTGNPIRVTKTDATGYYLFTDVIQNTYEIDYFQRMAFGASKALTENFNLGQEYVAPPSKTRIL